MLAVLLLVGASAAYLMNRRAAPGPAAAARACPSPVPSAPALPAPDQVHLSLLNGTSRLDLAKQVGGLLAARGFVVTSEGNAPAALAGASVVSYGPGALAAATTLAEHVVGARVAADPRAARGAVQLVLGSAYSRLATPAEVLAAQSAGAAAVAPAPTRSPCAT